MTRNNHHTSVWQHVALAICFFLMGLSGPADAAVPAGINYQAYLTNTDGSPVDTSVSVTFAAYNIDVGGVPLWSQTQSISVDQGLFTVVLGNPINPFPAGLFDGPVYIGMFVAGEELLPRRPFTSTAYSFKADDADTLDGVDAADLDQSSEVTTLQGQLGNAQTSITGLQSNVSSNESRIDALEVSGGDITGVVAGAGLNGGGSAGNVSLSIAPNSVTGVMIANGNVTSADLAAGSVTGTALAPDSVTSGNIQDGSVGPSDLNQLATYTLAGINVSGGIATFDTQADFIVNDSAHGLRWNSTDGATAHGNVLVFEGSMSMNHVSQANQIFTSNANGVGYAGATPTSGYAATVPSLNVLGSTNIGYEIVSTTYPLDVSVASCDTYGGDPCFFGVGTATCPAGKKVLGGGTTGSVPRYGAVGYNYPSSAGTSWFCSVSYDLANNTRVCYAICADVE